MIDNGIQDGMDQIIGPHLPETAFIVTQAVPDRLKKGVLFLLKRKDKIRPQDQADLFAFNFVVSIIAQEEGF